ncbi:MAG: MiaB/RimO family radical SAM methylthiotransferase [Actinobacteria bacterium]|nr:MiaB/RimO family radical SAM methylthiotransferase [Actinomycetota bacterium]
MTEGTFRVTTLGCKVNKADSVDIENHLFSSGLRRAAVDEVPEFWVINTCAVTAAGLQKSRKTVRKCIKSGSKVVVTGCGVDFDRREFDEMMPLGTFANSEKGEIVGTICSSIPNLEMSRVEFQAETCRLPLKIQDGCIHNCSYCIVPGLRISPWCLEKERVVEKVKFYKDRGAGEIILCGIDIGSYLDVESGTDLVELIKSIKSEVSGIWVRLSSVSPRDITGRLIELFEKDSGLCRHIHIPLQSGDDGVLEDMNRGYGALEYFEKIELVKEKVPDMSITTDILVGYPAEGEKAFENTVEMIRKTGFSKVHVFKYSPRPGTHSYAMGDPVSGMEKRRRSQIVMEVSSETAKSFHSRFIGKTVPVLVEEQSKSCHGELLGRTQWYSEVKMTGESDSVGRIVDVMIDGIDGSVLSGQIFSE